VEASDKFRAQAGLVLKDHLASVNVWGPIIDDQAVRLPPLPVAQDTPQKPVLIGFNQYEGALFVAPFAGQPASFYPEWLYSLFGKNMKSIMRAYPLVTANPVDPAAQVFTDYVFDCSSANFASGFAQAYRYEFTHQPSFKMLPLKECNNKACHTTELPFVFGNAELLVLPTGEKAKFTADEIQLSDSMQRYWTNFAKTVRTPPHDIYASIKWRDISLADIFHLKTFQFKEFDEPINLEASIIKLFLGFNYCNARLHKAEERVFSFSMAFEKLRHETNRLLFNRIN
jgi:carboxylesterase type B